MTTLARALAYATRMVRCRQVGIRRRDIWLGTLIALLARSNIQSGCQGSAGPAAMVRRWELRYSFPMTYAHRPRSVLGRKKASAPTGSAEACCKTLRVVPEASQDTEGR